MKLTLVMPLYNEEQLLRRSLTSIVQQINQNFELLMVNDASTDQTVTIAQEFIKHHANFRLLNQTTNQGISAARNRGISEAQGDLITFIDGDDWLEPQFTDYFLTCFQDQQLDLAVCGFVKESAKKVLNKISSLSPAYYSKPQLVKQITKMTNGSVMGYTWNKVYRLKTIRKYHLTFAPDLSLMEDQVFNIKYVAVTNRFYVDSTPLYHYWQHGQSATHTYNLQHMKSIGQANYRILKTLYQVKKYHL